MQYEVQLYRLFIEQYQAVPSAIDQLKLGDYLALIPEATFDLATEPAHERFCPGCPKSVLCSFVFPMITALLSTILTTRARKKTYRTSACFNET